MFPSAIDNVSPLVSERKLAAILGVPKDVLRELADLGDKLYRPFSLRKKNSLDSRAIDNPVDRLKVVQRRIYLRLLRLAPLPPFVFGGVVGKSVRQNAEPHVRQPWVVAVDIKKFFPSITVEQVAEVWRNHFGTGRKTTQILTRLTTFTGYLPQGAPTSTSLANLILAPALEEFAAGPWARDLKLSSWVDDISFSGRSAPDAINPLARVLSRHGFRIARKKTRAMSAGWRQETTGVVLNRKPSIGPRRKRMLRDEMRSPSARADNPRERGLIAHTLSICTSQGQRMRTILAKNRAAS